jgi:hypothetical protein
MNTEKTTQQMIDYLLDAIHRNNHRVLAPTSTDKELKPTLYPIATLEIHSAISDVHFNHTLRHKICMRRVGCARGVFWALLFQSALTVAVFASWLLFR